MKKYSIQCRVKPKRKSYIAGESKHVVANLLEQNFSAEGPNQKWVTDITYLPLPYSSGIQEYSSLGVFSSLVFLGQFNIAKGFFLCFFSVILVS